MLDVNHLCPGCMGLWEDTGKPCPHCGFSWETAPAGGRELPIFTILAGRYLLGRRIGIGGFGITYLAMNLTEERVTAIKEFFPASLASRESLEVAALPGEEGRYFREALRSFRKEADLLSRFVDVPGIVRYRDYVTENGTAYLVMDYIEGTNLRRYMRETGKTFSQDEALELMKPILLAVEAMHGKGVLHRDISPENLILKPDGTLTLIDFGAAREFSLDEEENLTVILKHGYAPEEQYHSGSRQGPWTDLYACCAVLYQMVSGIQPQDAAARAQKDNLLTLDEIEGVQVTERFARVVEKGMTIHATERYASIQALMAELYGDDTGQPEQKKQGERQEDKLEGSETEEQEMKEIPDVIVPEIRAEKEAGFEQGQPVLPSDTASSPEKKTADSVSDSRSRKSPDKTGMIMAAAAAALVVLVVLLVFRVIPLGGSGGAVFAEPDGTVWLVMGKADASCDTEVWYRYEYNEHGIWDKITSCGIPEHSYLQYSDFFMTDESAGVIENDFKYKYDRYGRIKSIIERTSEGNECLYQFTYWNSSTDMPKMIQSSDDSLNGIINKTINVNEYGYQTGIETVTEDMVVTITLEYTDSTKGLISQGIHRYYWMDTEDKEGLRDFIQSYGERTDFELYGVTYEMNENGEVTSYELTETPDGEGQYSSVYAEWIIDSGTAEAVDSVKSFLQASFPDLDGVKDEYGNVLEHEGIFYSYAEYEVKDGVYTPTGRTSGSLPDNVNTSSSQNERDLDNTEELMNLLEENGILVDSVENSVNFYDRDTVLLAVQAGELDGAFAEAKADPEDSEMSAEFAGDASGFYVVAPLDEWFMDDYTVNSLITGDMERCWEITMLLMDEGYYDESDSMYSLLTFLRETQDKKLSSKVSIDYTGTAHDKLNLQYLQYWGEKSGNLWEAVGVDGEMTGT